jgi:hypothetical protein
MGFGIFFILFSFGCATSNQTSPPRSATEQLLLSTAGDRALQSANFGIFANQKVFVDGSYYESYDAKYILGQLRDDLDSAGALLVNERNSADAVVEVRSGAHSIDNSDSLFGIPSTAAPVPLAGQSISLPELALYKSKKQHALSKVAVLAYERQTGRHFYSSGPLLGKAYNNYYKILLFISWGNTDIPEKHKKRISGGQ